MTKCKHKAHWKYARESLGLLKFDASKRWVCTDLSPSDAYYYMRERIIGMEFIPHPNIHRVEEDWWRGSVRLGTSTSINPIDRFIFIFQFKFEVWDV